MNRLTVLLFLSSCVFVAERSPLLADDLSIRIVSGGTPDAAVIELDEPLRVVLTNHSDEPISVRSIWTPTGYDQLSLHWVNLQTGKEYTLRRNVIETHDEWDVLATEYGPLIGDIAPGEDAAFRVSLPYEFDWDGFPGPNLPDQFQVVAVFQSTTPAQDGERPIWTGRIASEPVTVRFVATGIASPNDYLSRGFPDRALDIMMEDPARMLSRNVDFETPLHVAAYFGYAKVVDWLLENGADVNATANGFTPLHRAADPEVVSRLLEYDPDLSVRRRGFGQTPLQSAAANFADAREPVDQKKWRAICELILNASADFDLLTAIYLDDLPRVQEILKRSPEFADDFQGKSPLRVAASTGRLAIARYLIEEHEVDLDDFKRGWGHPIIIEAMEYPKIVEMLVSAGADLKTRITWRGFGSGITVIGDEATALHFAAQYGRPESVNLLIDRGVDIFARDENRFLDSGRTALEVACVYGAADNAIAILQHPRFFAANPELRQTLINACLPHAAHPGWFGDSTECARLVRELLAAGADPNAADQAGVRAIQIVADNIDQNSGGADSQFRQIVSMLREAGETLDVYTAVAVGDAAAVARLVKSDPQSVDARRPDGYPALHRAVAMNDAECIQILLDAGADVDIRNTDNHTGMSGETALHCAAFWGRAALAQKLIDAGADVTARTDRGATPLHSAARLRNVDVVRLLLNHGAQIDARNKEGKSPLDLCDELSWENVDETRKLLLEYTPR